MPAYTTSPVGIQMIKDFESFRAKAYKDPVGVWTIGYGSIIVNGVPVRPGQVITEPEAVLALQRDVQTIERALGRLIIPTLTQNQVDALVDFCYNLGVGAFTRSTLRGRINSGQPIDASLFTRWNKARDRETGKLVTLAGLTRRRQAEFVLFSRQT